MPRRRLPPHPAAAPPDDGANYIDSVDAHVLVRDIWFALPFDTYIRMRKVSRRWHKLYAASIRAARKRYLVTHIYFAEGEDTPRRISRFRAGRRWIPHGNEAVLSAVESPALTASFPYRFGVIDGICMHFCADCGRPFVFRIFLAGQMRIVVIAYGNCELHDVAVEIFRFYYDTPKSQTFARTSLSRFYPQLEHSGPPEDISANVALHTNIKLHGMRAALKQEATRL